MRVDIMWPHHTTRSCGLTGGKLANVRTLRRFVVRQQLCALTVCRPRPFHVKTLVVLAPVLATSAPDESMNWMNSRVLVCAVRSAVIWRQPLIRSFCQIAVRSWHRLHGIQNRHAALANPRLFDRCRATKSMRRARNSLVFTAGMLDWSR